MDNYIEYKATGKCTQFQNIFYTALATDIVVTVNDIETIDYEWIYGLKYVQLNVVPADGDRVRITNEALVVDPDPDLEIMRNDISVNTEDNITQQASIDALEAKDTSLDSDISALEDADVVHDGQLNALSAEQIAQGLRITDSEVDITSLEGAVAANIIDIAALTDQSAGVADLEIRMDATEADVIRIDAYILASRGLIEENAYAIDTMEAKYDHTAFGTRTILNNQAVPVALYDGLGDTLLVDADTEYTATMEVEYIRNTDVESRLTLASYTLIYNAGAWVLTRVSTDGLGVSASDGVTLSMTTTDNEGRLFYVSDDMPDANYEGTMRFKLYKTRNTL